MAKDLVNASVMDPDLRFQSMTPRRALSLLKEVRLELVSAGDQNIELVTRRSALQDKVLRALKVDTSTLTRPQSPSRAFTSRVVETLFPRDTIYLG
jgi:hypothetical protein